MMSIRRHAGPALMLVLALGAGTGQTQPAPSVQVQTVPLRQQTLADTVLGYGSVAPAADSLRTLSLARPGQVLQLWVSAGQKVRRGDALLAFGTGADARLAYRQAQQAVDFAQRELARQTTLLEQQLSTRAQLAAAQQALADAQARLQQQQRLGAGRERENLAAPFDGVVVAVSAAPGERLGAGAPLLQLAATGSQRVLVGVEPGDARRIRPGMAAQVQDLLGDGGSVPGRVTRVFGMIDAQTRLVNVEVALSSDGLLPGTRVAVTLTVARKTAWVLPRSAVLRDAQGAYVFQVGQGRARRVAVSTGLEQGDQVEIQGAALAADLPVVSLGNYELRDGMAVRGGGE